MDNSDEEEVECQTSISRRMYAAISYVFVLFGIGIPMWWYTTQLYRMALPDTRMEALGSAPLSMQFNMHLATQSQTFTELLLLEIHEHFQNNDKVKINIIKTQQDPSWLPKNLGDVEETASKIEVRSGDMFFIEWPQSPHEIIVTSYRVVYFTTETTSFRIIKLLKNWFIQTSSIETLMHNMKMPTFQKQDKTIRTSVPAAKKIDVLITVVNSDPESLTVKWDVKTAAYQYLKPFFDSINFLGDMTLKTQWLYYISMNDRMTKKFDNYVLYDYDLPHVITMLESRLGSHVSNDKCLNLIVYVTDCKHTPLNFYRSSGDAYKIPTFLAPRWGSLVAVNPDLYDCKTNNSVVVKPNSQEIMSIFLTHLRYLLSLKQLEPIEGVYLIPLTKPLPREWELDGLKRLRTFEQIISARLTLKSLAQLLMEITTIVINDDVGASIHAAVDNVEVAATSLINNDLDAALNKSRMAFLASEEAFYNPSLLALLYFPDDQKYAIYIPLFLPIMIPVIMSLNTIRQWMFSTKKIKNE